MADQYMSPFSAHHSGPMPPDLRRSSMGRSSRRSGAFKRSHSTPTDELPHIVVGVCAMNKKAQSKPMREILDRLRRTGEFEIINFGDETILNKPVEEWPVVQCLMSWFSNGFPLEKAQDYVRLRRPYLINDLGKQHLLKDRRAVYKTLHDNGVSVPKHVVVSRTEEEVEAAADPEGFTETEDHVMFNGTEIKKPFVEKPVDGDDHNIYIYYPHSMGGGVKKLFRKVNDKSADYDPTHPGHVRRDGSYIYENFLATGGTDVKVYTVGPRYAHAEARKSPVVDGRVQRSADGKEIRFPVLLSPHEKEIARLVSSAFGQKVCGFDLLRSEKGKSYVCDVNGWSFVKNSSKYYDDTAGLLRTIMLSALAPHRLSILPPQPLMSLAAEKEQEAGINLRSSTSEVQLVAMDSKDLNARESVYDELRCVLAVIRHGDRTPKQKLKMKVSSPPFLDLLMRHIDSKGKQAKLKSPNQLQELLEVTTAELAKMETGVAEEATGEADDVTSISSKAPDSGEEIREKLRIVRTVLEQGGHFSGINRKAQLKPTRWADSANGEPRRCVEAMLILKHGGVLTHAGRDQAEQLGLNYRMIMYPNQGGLENGLLRLHSTYRHDLKIYTADEGRVQSSAAAFTKGLLDLEGSSLTPILVSLVKKDASMLEAFGKGASADIRRAKAILYHQITNDPGVESSDGAALTTENVEVAESEMNITSPMRTKTIKIVDFLDDGGPATGSPKEDSSNGYLSFEDLNTPIEGMPEGAPGLLRRLVALVTALVDKLRDRCISDRKEDKPATYSALTQDTSEWSLQEGHPCNGERMLLMFDRWRKLLKSFYNPKTNKYDISKIPDIYDSIKYDAIHNRELDLEYEGVFKVAHKLAEVVIPSEYGITGEDKVKIGSKICGSLLGKILLDMDNMKAESLATATAAEPGDGDDPRYFEDSSGTWVDPHVMDGDPYFERTLERVTSSGDVEEGDLAEGESISGDSETDGEQDTLHRLCPAYASDVNSPLRHVRTRIYFTSESHIHSLVNVLRFCHLGRSEENPIIGEKGEDVLAAALEKDYLTQIVFQLYENKRVPVDDPKRFRVELSFSDGSAISPFDVMPMKHMPHTLPLKPRQFIHRDDGVSLESLEAAIAPHSEEWNKKSATEQFSTAASNMNDEFVAQ
mmetsp:Transcript_36118/g.91148  ORF Transcript_36118/g.91148 Transcript_36118/m.91148 type:complete len:1152 (-) Transcript_36118:379-3834(-)